jgi:hypothetical protein
MDNFLRSGVRLRQSNQAGRKVGDSFHKSWLAVTELLQKQTDAIYTDYRRLGSQIGYVRRIFPVSFFTTLKC